MASEPPDSASPLSPPDPAAAPPKVAAEHAVPVGLALAVVVLLGVLAAVGWVVSGKLQPSAPPAGLLRITSQPEGATIRIGGVERGQTPFFGDNTFPAGTIAVELRRPGYWTWKGTFQGARAETINVTLVKKAPAAPKDAGAPAPEVTIDPVVEVRPAADFVDESPEPKHQKGPLRPPPAPVGEFVDDALDAEAAAKTK